MAINCFFETYGSNGWQKKLAKQESIIDGVIAVKIIFIVDFIPAAKIGGKLPAGAIGRQRAVVEIKIKAYHHKGGIVWKDTVRSISKTAVAYTDGGAQDFKNLKPLLLEATQAAADKLIIRLDQKVDE